MNIYSPLEKTYFDVTSANFLITNFNTVAPHLLQCNTYVATNQRVTSSVYSSLFLFFPPPPFALHEFSIEYQSVGKTIISVHRSHRQKPCAFWNGIPLPLSPTRCRSIFASSSSPQKTTLSFRPQGNKLFQQVIIVVVASFDPGNEK